MREFWKGESAEKDFLIDPESGYFAAHTFAQNPVTYLETFRIDLLDNNADEGEIGIQAIEKIREMCHVIINENITLADNKVAQLVQTEDLSLDWARQVFSLLKSAGYSKASVKTWLLLDEPFIHSDEEFNASRMLNQQLGEVYGEE